MSPEFYMELAASTNSLQHHGVEGQKWGVRNGPPYPIEDKTLKKGSKLATVSLASSSSQILNGQKWVYTYNPDNKHDSAVYKGPFSTLKLRKQPYNVFIKEYTYETVKDLKLADSTERMQAFKDLYASNKRMLVKDLKTAQSYLNKIEDAGLKLPESRQKAKDINVKKLQTTEEYTLGYNMFCMLMENNQAYKSTREFSKIMSQQYDGMVDDNNVIIYNSAQDPIIIFNPKESLRLIDVKLVADDDQVKAQIKRDHPQIQLDDKTIKENMDYVTKYQTERGLRVAL